MILVLFPTAVLVLCLLYEIYYYFVYLSDTARSIVKNDEIFSVDSNLDDRPSGVPGEKPILAHSAVDQNIVHNEQDDQRKKNGSGADSLTNVAEPHSHSTVSIDTLNLVISPDGGRYAGRATPTSLMIDNFVQSPAVSLERATAFQENEPAEVEPLFEKDAFLGAQYKTEKVSVEYSIKDAERRKEDYR